MEPNIITRETVNVRDLNPGDLVISSVGLVEVTETPKQSRGKDQSNGGVWYCRTIVVNTLGIHPYAGVSLGSYWDLQGNDLFSMDRVTIDNPESLLG